MESIKKDNTEYFIFTNPLNCIWNWDRALVSKEKYWWIKFSASGMYNDLYQGVIPNNIRKATEEEIIYAKKNNWSLYWYKIEDDIYHGVESFCATAPRV